MGFDSTKTVFSQQVHRDDVRVVTEADCGKGLYRERDYDSADGLVTNCPGIPLAIFSADCIPVLFHDPVTPGRRRLSRWLAGHCRGHRGEDGAGDDASSSVAGPENIRMAIGPGISRCCFETHDDVPHAMWAVLGKQADPFIDRLPREKFLVDLKGINGLWGQLAGRACQPN